MHQISRIRTLLMAFCWFSGSVADLKGEDDLRAQDLAGLSQRDRVAVMRALLQRRIDKLGNVEISSETYLTRRKWLAGKVGDCIYDAGRWQFHTLYRDGSYRVKSTKYTSAAPKEADTTSVSHYDKEAGIVRIASKGVENDRHQGRIGDRHVPSMNSNRVVYHLLAGSHVHRPWADKSSFLLDSLQECSDKWQVEVDVQKDQIVISHPYRIAFVNYGDWGVRKVIFNVAKGMLPVRIEIDYRAELPTQTADSPTQAGVRKTIWREERVAMDEPKQFGGLWMATRIEERTRTGQSGDSCQVFLTKVNKIDFGAVRNEDLAVKFPANTKVADTLQNVFYETGPDGEPKGQVHPIGVPKGTLKKDAQGQIVLIPEEPKSNWVLRVGIWAIGIGGILLVGVFMLKKYLTYRAIA